MDVEGRRGVGEEGIDTPTGGGAQSTEGAWAAMRSRIEDVRRGEAGTDERICLGWVMAPSKDDDASAGADAISDTGSAKSKLNPSPAAGGFDSPAAQRRRAAARSSLGVDTPRPTEHGANISAARNRSSAAPEYHLIALTTSGGWYRLSLSDVAESGAEEAGGGSDDGGSESDNGRRRSTVLDMYREDREGGEPGTGARSQHGQATGTGKGGKKRATRGAEGCSLEEYRRFGSSNEWV